MPQPNDYRPPGSLLPLILVLSLLCTSVPLRAESWTERLFGWFQELIGLEEEPDETVDLEALRATPMGRLLSEVADYDTLAVGTQWPLLDLGEANTERWEEARTSVRLLQRGRAELPLRRGQAVRVIYRSDQRPRRLIDHLKRLVDVQEVPFAESLVLAAPAAPALPTLIVVDASPGLSSFNSDWYRSLYAADWPAGALLVNFGDFPTVNVLPDDWTLLTAPFRLREYEQAVVHRLFGPEASGFAPPAARGLDPERLEKVDGHLNRAIRYRAMPGAQLLVIKDGDVVYEKSYGYQSNRREQPVDVGDLYDLASVTKAAATTLAVMKLYEEGHLDLRERVKAYLPEFAQRPVGRYRIDQLLSHQTGLQADLPLFGYLGRAFVSDSIKENFTLPIGEHRWLDNRVPANIRADLGTVNYTRRPIHRYSDVNYVVLQMIVEEITGGELSEFVAEEFYRPMGLGKLFFRPAATFPAERLVPTSLDKWMRGGILRGYVQDEGAALLGGVAGHAGLFGNAYQLGLLFEMLNRGGKFEGQRYLKAETVATFTKRNPYNRRALGFDSLRSGWSKVVAAGASKRTFGHTGFTGTCVWADPDNDLVFVLLTNRVHPDSANDKFYKMGVRSRVHRQVYRALIEEEA